MLQSGVGTRDLDVQWVSSLSWYFLTLFGLQPVYNFILGSNNGKWDVNVGGQDECLLTGPVPSSGESSYAADGQYEPGGLDGARPGPGQAVSERGGKPRSRGPLLDPRRGRGSAAGSAAVKKRAAGRSSSRGRRASGRGGSSCTAQRAARARRNLHLRCMLDQHSRASRASRVVCDVWIK